MDKAHDPWAIDETAFPHGGTPAEIFRFLLQYAVLAPSSHNTQPWLFRVRGDRLELWADTARTLPVADPQRRELVISCGAALFNLRLALRHFHYAGDVELLPDPYQPGLLADVGLGKHTLCGPGDERLFRAIQHRHTYRGEFDSEIVFESVTDTLQSAAHQAGAWFQAVTVPEARHAVAHLVAEADLILLGNKQYRAELANWIRPNLGTDHDGIPGYALGLNDITASLAPLWLRFHDTSATTSQRDATLVTQAPLLGVLGTPNDTLADWLAAGQALAHLLLQARVHGVHAAFHNQPIEVPAFRIRLAGLLHRPGLPQVLLRLGHAPEPRPTPRRTVAEVWDVSRS